jgi:hypothetical protein
VSQGKSRQGGGKGKAPAARKRSKKRGKKKQPRKTAIDPNRPLWENPAGEAAVRSIVGTVRLPQSPTALVRSLGPPPLGRFSDNAEHYYDAVYDKAQRFALAMAMANGLLVEDGTEHDHASGSAASGGDLTITDS